MIDKRLLDEFFNPTDDPAMGSGRTPSSDDGRRAFITLFDRVMLAALTGILFADELARQNIACEEGSPLQPPTTQQETAVAAIDLALVVLGERAKRLGIEVTP